jgi:hypothetical protein
MHAVHGGGFFEACFGAAVNGCRDFAAERLCCFDDSALYASEVAVWRLRVKDG